MKTDVQALRKICEEALAKAGNPTKNKTFKKVVNNAIRQAVDYSQFPVYGKFNAANRAIFRLRKLEQWAGQSPDYVGDLCDLVKVVIDNNREY